MTKKVKKQLEELLDERWSIYECNDRNEDLLYYKGIIKAVECAGNSWIRNETGNHKIF